MSADPAVRVLLVGPGFRFTSGISYYTLQAANALAGRAVTSVLLMRRLIPRGLYPGAARVGRSLHGVRYHDSVAVEDGVDWYWGRSMWRAARFVGQHPPDVVVLQWWTAAVGHTYLFVSWLARRRGARVVVEWHEVQDTGEARVPGARACARLLARRILRHADGHIVHSQHDVGALHDAYGLATGSCVVVPLGPFDYLAAEPPAVPSRAASGTTELLWFGVIRPYKGLEDLVAAFGDLDPEPAARFRLTIVGEPWEDWTAPFDAIAESPYRDRITVVDRYVTDAELAAHIAAADAIALPYRRSSASGPLHLAMSAGKPVLITAVGGLPEAAEGYAGAVVIPPGDRAALAKGLLLLEDRAGERYEDIRTWDVQVAAYLGFAQRDRGERPGGRTAEGGAEAVADLELAGGLAGQALAAHLPPAPAGGWSAARLLVRAWGEPLGMLRTDDLDATEHALAQLVMDAVGSAVGERHPDVNTAADLLRPLSWPPPGRAEAVADVLAEGPAVTAVVCTRDRPEPLRRALESLARLSYPRVDVLVVDNASRGDATRGVVADVAAWSPIPMRLVVEPRPGLSWARNRALAEPGAPILAWLDDDEVADPDWITEVASVFHRDEATAAVSGAVVPAAIKNAAQARYEAFGGHSKGRAWRPEVFQHGEMARSPLYPLPAFGIGANMAFRREALVGIGGFDVALGSGTLTGAGEDTLAFSEVLLAGQRVRYHPAAIVRHHHRDDEAGLHHQLRSYGTGLTAFYSALLRRHPGVLLDLVRLVPRAWRELRDPRSVRNAGDGNGFPADLRRANVTGMVAGPLAYARASWRARRMARQ